MLDQFARPDMPLHAVPRAKLDMLGKGCKRDRAKFTRLILELVRRKDERRRLTVANGIFDSRHGLGAIFPEIAEKAHEAIAQLTTGIGKRRPVDLHVQRLRHVIPFAASFPAKGISRKG